MQQIPKNKLHKLLKYLLMKIGLMYMFHRIKTLIKYIG